MASEFEFILEQPFEGYPFEDVCLPEFESHAMHDLTGVDREDFIDRLYRGYLNPGDETAFSDCFKIAYMAALQNTLGKLDNMYSKDANQIQQNKRTYENAMAEARGRLYNYVQVIARVLGRGGVVTHAQDKGYIDKTSNWTSEADENGEWDKRKEKYEGSNTKEVNLEFEPKTAKQIVEDRYKAFINDKPIYRPFARLKSREDELRKTIERRNSAEKEAAQLKAALPGLKLHMLLHILLMCVILPIVPGIPLFWAGSDLYVVVHKLYNFRYEAEWFMNDSAGNPILRLLEFIAKIPGMITEWYMAFTCKPTNGSRIFWIVLAFIVAAFLLALAAGVTFFMVYAALAPLEANEEMQRNSRMNLSEVTEQLPALRQEADSAKAKLDALLATDEYRQAKQTNQKLAEAYRDFYKPIVGKLKIKKPKTDKA